MANLFRFRHIDTEVREAMLDRLDRMTELPLLLLSFIMIPVLLGPLLWEDSFSTAERALFQTLDIFIWAIFAADFFLKFAITPEKLRYLRRHWLEALTVLVPFLRPLRILRIVLFGVRAVRAARRLVNVDFLIVYAIGIVVIAATVVAGVERGHDSINSFTDALWWSVVTATTVGYGDMTPITPVGRGMAVLLMLVGIGLFGGLTANFASTIFRTDDNVEANTELLLDEMRSLRTELVELRQSVDVARQGSQQAAPTRGFALSAVTNIIRRPTSVISNIFRRGGQPAARQETGDDSMPDAQTFRQAWGKFATGVSVITTVQADDEIHGMTANGITSVSLDPLLALVCTGHTTASYPLIKESGRFAINILNEDQRAIAEYYARPTDQKTGDVPASFSRTAQGAATLDGSLAYMDCRVVDEYVAGDHTIFIGEVEEIHIDSDGDRPLLYFEGRFNRLPSGA